MVSGSQSDKYHYVGYRRIRQNDLYLLMYQDEVKVKSELSEVYVAIGNSICIRYMHSSVMYCVLTSFCLASD